MYVAAKTENLHTLFIPLTNWHTEPTMFEVSKELLRALLGIGSCKRLHSVATNGAAKMMGRYKGAIMPFEQTTLPGFFCIWYVSHQQELAVQYVMSCVSN